MDLKEPDWMRDGPPIGEPPIWVGDAPANCDEPLAVRTRVGHRSTRPRSQRIQPGGLFRKVRRWELQYSSRWPRLFKECVDAGVITGCQDSFKAFISLVQHCRKQEDACDVFDEYITRGCWTTGDLDSSCVVGLTKLVVIYKSGGEPVPVRIVRSDPDQLNLFSR